MDEVIDLRANGKLLLAGEYLVLSGARALALPVRFGQRLRACPISNPLLRWSACQPSGKWFGCEIDLNFFQVLNTTDNTVSGWLVMLLHAARLLNPGFLRNQHGYIVTTETEYPMSWGLGSSSTLIAMVAHWAAVPVFDLFRLISNGSGFDIACADRSSLISYQLQNGLPLVSELNPGKALRSNTYFAWLGKKQESHVEVEKFLQQRFRPEYEIARISEIALEISNSESVGGLIELVKEHEQILGSILCKEPVAERFPGFPGTVKSLGAWGGDFVMFVTAMELEGVKNFLLFHGITDVFTFDEVKAN